MICFLEESKIFEIRTKNSSYLLGLGRYLQHLYWGKPVRAEDGASLFRQPEHSSFDKDIHFEREEYSFFTGESYAESCIKAEYEHIRKLDMRYESHEISTDNGVNRLLIRMKNSYSALYVTLVYEVYDAFDIIAKYAVIENNGEAFTLTCALSGSLVVPHLKEYRLRYTVGKWNGESQLKDIRLDVGKFILQSKRGSTGPHFNPSFAIDDGTCDETGGNVWYGMLAYSGNWKIDIEKTIFNNVRIVGGINDFDFSYRMENGERFVTPTFVQGFTGGGYGSMSRNLHEYQRQYILPRQVHARVLYNSWEATYFDVTVAEQKALAEKACAMGVELFVVDDGWFGKRNHERAGLGDWYVNPDKFPNGLQELIDHVTTLGMDFGIWVEPEAVNPDSELYRAHPDWIYRFNGLEPIQARHQYVLNITKPEVKQYILAFMCALLSENPKITFIKWDMNRSISDPSAGNTETDKALWYRHVIALYEIWEELRNRFPHVEFETCSGGGGRIDLGILRYAEQCWPSDNTDAYDRLFIQEGFSCFYNPRIMMCWVTDNAGKHKCTKPLSYKFHAAMQGALGIGANINLLDQATLDAYAVYIQAYKEIRETIQFGSLYRLLSPRDGNLTANEYISSDKNEVIVFLFLHGQQYGDENPWVKLQGLEENALYELSGEDGSRTFRGDSLMHIGIQPCLYGDLDSRLLRFQKRG